MSIVPVWLHRDAEGRFNYLQITRELDSARGGRGVGGGGGGGSALSNWGPWTAHYAVSATPYPGRQPGAIEERCRDAAHEYA